MKNANRYGIRELVAMFKAIVKPITDAFRDEFPTVATVAPVATPVLVEAPTVEATPVATVEAPTYKVLAPIPLPMLRTAISLPVLVVAPVAPVATVEAPKPTPKKKPATRRKTKVMASAAQITEAPKPVPEPWYLEAEATLFVKRAGGRYVPATNVKPGETTYRRTWQGRNPKYAPTI